MRQGLNKSTAGRLALLGLLLFAQTGAAAAAAAGHVEILVNPDEAKVTIDRDLLRAIFTMRLRQWPSGEPIRVFILPDDDALSGEFFRSELGTYPYVLRSLWDRMVYTGTGLAPTVVKNQSEMRERVLSTPGAIGYIGNGQSRLLNLFNFGLAWMTAPHAPPQS